MQLDKIKEVRLADGQIRSLEARAGSLIVRIEDWQEQSIEIEFEGVEGFLALSPENEDLSHVLVADDWSRVLTAEPEESGAKCVAFVSAWEDREVLQVVASAFKVTPPLD